MRRFMVLSFVLCLAAGGCGQPSTQQDSRTKPRPPIQEAPASSSSSAEGAELGDFVVGKPVCYKNLAIFPVSSKVPKNDDRYITLEEGLKAGTVEIFEVGASGLRVNAPGGQGSQQPAGQPAAEEMPDTNERDPFGEDQGTAQTGDPFAQQPAGQQQEVAGEVNRLMVLNRSGRPLYLMPGEVIYGGKQDRTIATEAIILAGDKPVPVDVYCVEEGRWEGRMAAEQVEMLTIITDGQQTGETAEKLAAEANRGKFVTKAGNLSKQSRYAVQAGKGQTTVWGSVGVANQDAGVQTSSNAFTANYADPGVLKRLKTYIDRLQAPVAEQKQVVGAIVAINGKVEAVDVFESTPLFRKLWPKLLKGHALDAANAAGKPEAKKVCTLGDAKKFLTDAMQAEVEKKTQTEGGLLVTQRNSQGVVSFSAAAEDASDAAYMGMGMGGFGGSVHSSAFAK